MSLWPVDDEATAVLMDKFYSKWSAGETKAESLRAAQLEMMATERWREPIFWAGWVLSGNPD